MRGSCRVEVDAPPEAVFDLVHDYGRRLEWDTLLSDARILGGAPCAGKGVRTLCTGRGLARFVAMETEYVSFERGRVAAVRLLNRPPLFERFAASIRHRGLPGGRSEVTYVYSFRAQPRWLERIVGGLLHRETRRRLEALRAWFGQGKETRRPARSSESG